jgi:hypothetical protein
MVRDVEIIINHGGLSHVIEYLVRVDEFGSLLKVKDTGVNCGLEAIFKLEVA